MPHPRRSHLVLAAGITGALVLAGCGDSDESAEDRYCNAGDEVEASIEALTQVDVVGGGLNAVEAAFEDVSSSLEELDEAGREFAADEIDAVQGAVDELTSALDGLGDEGITEASATAVVSAIDGVGQAAGALQTTLNDTCS